MERIKYFLLALIFLMLLSRYLNNEEGNFKLGIRKVYLEDHSYIVYRGFHCCSMLHDVDCLKCKQSTSES